MTNKLGLLSKINLIYGLLGFFILLQFGAGAGWKSFLAGWIVAVVNLELLKRIGTMLMVVYSGQKVSPIIYGLVVGKFLFWGLVIALLTLTHWIEPMPFVIGTLTILVAGLGLGVKEVIYARA